jgi:hypothetical protein
MNTRICVLFVAGAIIMTWPSQASAQLLHSWENGLEGWLPTNDPRVIGFDGALVESIDTSMLAGVTHGAQSLAVTQREAGFSWNAQATYGQGSPQFESLADAVDAGADQFSLELDVTYNRLDIPQTGPPTFLNLSIALNSSAGFTSVHSLALTSGRKDETIGLSIPLDSWTLPASSAKAQFFQITLAMNGDWGSEPATVYFDNLRLTRPTQPASLTLSVDADTGQMTINNLATASIGFNYYEITSAEGTLNPAEWSSLDAQNIDAIDGPDPGAAAGDGVLEGWDAAGGAGPRDLTEAFLTGMSELAPGDFLSLGAAYNRSQGARDLVFRYRNVTQPDTLRDGLIEYFEEGGGGLIGDYNASGTVEQGDLDLVLLNWGQGANAAPPTWLNDLPSGLIDQEELDGVLLRWGETAAVRAATIPEPAGVTLVAVLLASCLGVECSRRWQPRWKAFVWLCGAVLLAARPALAQPEYRGMSLTSFSQNALLSPASDQSIANMAAIGVDTVALNFFWFQDDELATTIEPDYSFYSASPASLAHAVDEIHANGMQVLLKPIVDLRNGVWRAEIEPSGAWLDSYRDFIYDWALFAEEHGVEALSIGTEYRSSEPFEADWREIIAGVRDRYAGQLTYAADYGSYQSVAWWDALDYIGIDAYFPLSDDPDAPASELRRAWSDLGGTIEGWREGANLDQTILFTEVGYRSADGAVTRPWDFNYVNSVDLNEQTQSYEALLSSLWSENWWDGAFWWNWETDPNAGGPNSTSYTPQNKPAEDVLAEFYQIAAGDLNRDGAIDAADWRIFLGAHKTDLSGLSPLAARRLGDFNGDLASDFQDFLLFEQAFDRANGAGALADLAAGVPEPAGLVLALLGIFTCGWAASRGRRRRQNGVGSSSARGGRLRPKGVWMM